MYTKITKILWNLSLQQSVDNPEDIWSQRIIFNLSWKSEVGKLRECPMQWESDTQVTSTCEKNDKETN
jgi:hypothetical protein